MLVGNKSDLKESRCIEHDEGLEFSIREDILFSEMSAKTGENVTESFNQLIEGVLEAPKESKVFRQTENLALSANTKMSDYNATILHPREKPKC
mmetsp:Transcript_17801/g.17511  ORF Transcript_17801/g.17511 Transcript_17801/m.17511 type:complete len:94 (+) Transcript_17801:363-644(+)